jgi:hypothetical protein
MYNHAILNSSRPKYKKVHRFFWIGHELARECEVQRRIRLALINVSVIDVRTTTRRFRTLVRRFGDGVANRVYPTILQLENYT